MILSDVKDEKIEKTIGKVVETWGGSFFFQMGISWKTVLKRWKAKNGIVVHLTAYGENIQTSDVIQRIRATKKDVLVIVGSQKVPSEFFSHELSDFNIAIGNQPHSECSSLAVFLDRFFKGKELEKNFKNGELQIIPQKHGKKVISKGKV
jgi:tRNA (cytidine56-2'-O)-methyltransferase